MRFLDGLDADTQSMFTGQRRSVLHCSACMHTTDKVEPFMHVTVSVCPRLEDSIKDFCGQEILDAPCAKCGVHGALQKQLHLAVTPEVMIFQIQRGTSDRKKNSTLVGYPLTLTVSSIMYDLVSVVTHEGPHLSTGHCTAIVKCSSNVWHMVDDAVSRRIPEKNTSGNEASCDMFPCRWRRCHTALLPTHSSRSLATSYT